MQDDANRDEIAELVATMGINADVDDDGRVTVDVVQTFDKTFGARMRQARDRLDWSQRKLAEELERLGVKLDPSAVTRIERGTREVKLREASAIATALGVKLEELAPPPTSTPREQFDAWVLSASEQISIARRALTSMATCYVMALHVIDHHPDLIKSFGIDPKELGTDSASQSVVAHAIAQSLRDQLSKSPPVLIVGNSEQAEQLVAIIDAAVSNLIKG